MKNIAAILKPFLKKEWLNPAEAIKNPLLVNIVIVGSITFAVKIIGFYKETVVAAYFGLSELLDTFFIAFLIPSFIQNVFINALKSIFIPNYIQELEGSGNKGSFQVLVFILVFGICVVLSLLTLVFSEFFLDIMFKGHTSSYYELIRSQLYVLLPCVFFWGFGSILSGLLEIDNKYVFTSASGVFIAVSIIVCLKFFNESMGNLVLAIGTLIGSSLGFLTVLIVALRFKILRFGMPVFNKNTRSMVRQLFPKVSSGLLSGLNNFVDQFFAAQLAIGSITALNYGLRFPAFTISILILALGNVLLPHFSRLVNTDIKKAYTQLFFILRLLFFGALCVAIVLILFSNNIVEFFFERKEFTSEDTVIVANVQKIAFIYVPFYICTLVLVRFLTSINRNSFMAWVSLLSLTLNIILNTILIKYFKVYGLIMATTIIYIITSIIFVTFTLKQRKLAFKQLNT